MVVMFLLACASEAPTTGAVSESSPAGLTVSGEELLAKSVPSGTPCAGGARPTSWYVDRDGDGWGTGRARRACDQPTGWVSQTGDCNDRNAAIHPNALEVADGSDNDCDGTVDEDMNSAGRCVVNLSVMITPNPSFAMGSPFWIWGWFEGYSDEYQVVTWDSSNPPSSSDADDVLTIMLTDTDVLDHPWVDLNASWDQMDADTWASWLDTGCDGYTAWVDNGTVTLYEDSSGSTSNCRAYLSSTPSGGDVGVWVPAS